MGPGRCVCVFLSTSESHKDIPSHNSISTPPPPPPNSLHRQCIKVLSDQLGVMEARDKDRLQREYRRLLRGINKR